MTTTTMLFFSRFGAAFFARTTTTTKGEEDNNARRRKEKKTTTMEDAHGRRRRRRKSNDTNEDDDDEDDEEDIKEEKIYVWKRGIALEEKKVPRENQAKIDALYPKTTTTTKEKESSSSLYYRRVDARDILRTYAKTREEEDALKQTSIASQLLLFATVFAYAVGFAVTTHRGVVDLSTPAPIECEKSDAECTEETLPKRVEVFVSL